MARGPLAGTSGPGKFSKRTDMTLPSAGYGEGVETAAIQGGAPMAKSEDIKTTPPSQLRREVGRKPTRLYDDSERIDEPITTGIAKGDGAGPEALSGGPAPEDDTNFRASIRAYMPVLTYISGLPSTSPETRKAIRQLRDNL